MGNRMRIAVVSLTMFVILAMSAYVIICRFYYRGVQQYYHSHGFATGDGYGIVAGAGDVNNDGYADFIVGTWNWYPDTNHPHSNPMKGWVRVYSGVDGSILYYKTGLSDGDRFGASVSNAGDVNADGYSDFIVGAPEVGVQQGAIYVYSGYDGSLLYEKIGEQFDYLGYMVSECGDVNNDGYDDFMATARHTGVFVFSGADGTLMAEIIDDPIGGIGETIAAAGDVNGDRISDILIAGGRGYGLDTPRVHIYFGPDLNTKETIVAPIDNVEYFGEGMCGLGDINDDGFDDFVITNPQYGDNEFVWVYSGKDLTIIYSLSGEEYGPIWPPTGVQVPLRYFGCEVSSTGDINGDGDTDFVVGAAGSVLVFSGFTGELIEHIEHYPSYEEGNLFGFHVASIGDINGNGRHEFIVGAIGEQYINPLLPDPNQWAGAAYVYGLKGFYLCFR